MQQPLPLNKNMNKEGRKYLDGWVEKGFQKEIEALKKRRYPRPLLDSFLVAQAMEGKLKFKPISELTESIKKKLVLGRGKKQGYGGDDKPIFVEWSGDDDEDRTYYNRRTGRYEEYEEIPTGHHTVTVEAEALFVIPKEYYKEVEKWEKNEQEIIDAIKVLKSTKESIQLKINVGSDVALESTVAAIDSIQTLDALNTKLIQAGTVATAKRLGD